MTTTAEKIAIMQAAENGEQVQCIMAGGAWNDILPTEWSWGTLDYRVKPKATYDWSKVQKDSLIEVGGELFYFSHYAGSTVFFYHGGATSVTSTELLELANYADCEVVELNNVENALIDIMEATGGDLDITEHSCGTLYFELDGYFKG